MCQQKPHQTLSLNNNLIMCWKLTLSKCGEEVDLKDWLRLFEMQRREMHHPNRWRAAAIQACHIKPQLSW